MTPHPRRGTLLSLLRLAPLGGSFSPASLRSAALLSSLSSGAVLCVFPHRAHRAHRAHNAHRAHCPRLPPRKTHGVSRHRRAARVAPPGLKPFCLPSGGSRRCAALHRRLIRGRRFAAFFLPRFAWRLCSRHSRHFLSASRRKSADAAPARAWPASQPDGEGTVGLDAAVAQPAIHSKAHTHVWRLLSLFDTIMEKTIKT